MPEFSEERLHDCPALTGYVERLELCLTVLEDDLYYLTISDPHKAYARSCRCVVSALWVSLLAHLSLKYPESRPCHFCRPELCESQD